MSNSNSGGGLKSIFATLAIFICVAIGFTLYYTVFKDGSHFEGGDPEKGHPIDVIGTVAKGGVIVPILLSVLLIIITFSIERGLTIAKSKGKGAIEPFVRKIKGLLASGDIDAAIMECDKQKGSLGNVVKAGLERYKMVQHDSSLDKDSKVEAITKELEEATALELPMLSKNLVIISTCASIATLIGLIGTVIGMIRSFQAMATGGAPDTAQLSLGISEALINTFLGISGSAIAIIIYNLYSTRIDSLTYAMDEASYTIVSEFKSSGK